MNVLLPIVFVLVSNEVAFTSSVEAEESTRSHFKQVDTLPEDVTFVYHALNGDYWFGSRTAGVFCYDGQHCTQFTTDDGLPHSQVVAIQAGHDGTIYVDTLAGPCSFDGNQFHAIQLSQRDELDVAWELTANNLWFHGSWAENGPTRFDGDSLTKLKFPSHPLEGETDLTIGGASFSPFGIYSIFRDDAGAIWFGTSNVGVCRFDGKSLQWIVEDQVTELDRGPAPGVRSIVQDQAGDFWFSNDLHHRYRLREPTSNDSADVLAYDRIVNELLTQQEGFPTFCQSMTADKRGRLWFATYDDGLWVWDGEKLHHHDIVINDSDCRLVHINFDREGTIWLGTQSNGPVRYNGESFERFDPFKD